MRIRDALDFGIDYFLSGFTSQRRCEDNLKINRIVNYSQNGP